MAESAIESIAAELRVILVYLRLACSGQSSARWCGNVQRSENVAKRQPSNPQMVVNNVL